MSEEQTNGTSISNKEESVKAESSPTITNVPSSTVVDTTNSPVPLQAQAIFDQVTAAQEEHNGEVVVENDEDTVIY